MPVTRGTATSDRARAEAVIPARLLLAAGACTVLAVLPVFLTGAMAVLIREDLGFSEARLGIAVSSFYVVSAAVSASAGRLSDRLGARRTLGLAAATSSVSLGGIALVARSWWQLVAFLVVGGIGNAIAQPASNLALARLIRPGRQGLAFGLKQASAPAATLVAGAAVPLVGLTVGWRWAFVLAISLAAAYALAMPPRDRLIGRVNASSEGAAHASTRSLLLLSGAVTLAVATASSLPSFFVESAVAQGWSPAVAGTWMAVASVTSIVARVIWGRVADRTDAGLGLVAGLMIVGATGILLLGRVATLPVLAAASVLSFGAGWGWPGLFQFSVVRLRANAPGEATGIVMIGMFLGGVYGPSTFGFLVEHGGYRLAWTVAAAAMLAGATLLLVGGRIVDPERGRSRRTIGPDLQRTTGGPP